MEKQYLYTQPQSKPDAFKVGIVGIAGRVGSTMVAALQRFPDLTVTGGLEISTRNIGLRGLALEAAGLALTETSGKAAADLLHSCDLILDARPRNIRFPEDLKEADTPILAQSAGNEPPLEDEATHLFLPAECDPSLFMRVGDCNVTALSAVLAPMNGYIAKADAHITMMSTHNPESDWMQDLAIHSLTPLPTEKCQALYEPLFRRLGVDFHLHGLVQTGGIQCYLHQLSLELRPGIKPWEFLSALSQAPHVLVFPDSVRSTFELMDRAQRFQTLGKAFPPVVVFGSTFSEENNRCKLNIGVLNKHIATAGNTAAVRHLADVHFGSTENTGLQAMKTTDKALGWSASKDFFWEKLQRVFVNP